LEVDAAQRLLAAGLIEEHGALQPTARCYATFSYGRRWEPPRLIAIYSR
jgi:hypothetical protein